MERGYGGFIYIMSITRMGHGKGCLVRPMTVGKTASKY